MPGSSGTCQCCRTSSQSSQSQSLSPGRRQSQPQVSVASDFCSQTCWLAWKWSSIRSLRFPENISSTGVANNTHAYWIYGGERGRSSYLPIWLKVRKTLNICEFRAKKLTTKCGGMDVEILNSWTANISSHTWAFWLHMRGGIHHRFPPKHCCLDPLVLWKGEFLLQ